MAQTLLMVVNVDWFFLSHRLPIAVEAKKRGYNVTIAAIEEDGLGDKIRSYGFKFVPLPSSRGGKNFLSEFKLLWFLVLLFRREAPDIVHNVAIKPVLYGSIAARFSKVKKVVNSVSGLGSLFIEDSDKGKTSVLFYIVKQLYRFSFKAKKVHVIVQNADDAKQIIELTAISPKKVFLISGSGVNLSFFTYTEGPAAGPIIVSLPSRMLWHKGVGEFVQAANILKPKYGDKVQFILAGKFDSHNSSAIGKDQLEAWNAKGFVSWIGHQDDMRALYNRSHIVVLPSYREGLSKSLIEACAVGRPIVTTRVPGCQDVVTHGVNGFLVEAKAIESLAASIENLIQDSDLRNQMGQEGRKRAEDEFSIEAILNQTFSVYDGVANPVSLR